MPNWTCTTYVFKSKEKEPIRDFHDRLLLWTSEKSLIKGAWDGSPYWLGNILLHAGFEYNKEKHGFDCCRCRGSLEDIAELEESDICGEHFFHFSINTETAWTEMPKMWDLIINKFYPGKIEFGFEAVDECHEYINRYNPHLLKHIGVDFNEKYWVESFADSSDNKEYQWINGLCTEISSNELAAIFSNLLERPVTEEEIEAPNTRQNLLYDANELLTSVNEDFYIKIIEIKEVSRDSFE